MEKDKAGEAINKAPNFVGICLVCCQMDGAAWALTTISFNQTNKRGLLSRDLQLKLDYFCHFKLVVEWICSQRHYITFII